MRIPRATAVRARAATPARPNIPPEYLQMAMAHMQALGRPTTGDQAMAQQAGASATTLPPEQPQ